MSKPRIKWRHMIVLVCVCGCSTWFNFGPLMGLFWETRQLTLQLGNAHIIWKSARWFEWRHLQCVCVCWECGHVVHPALFRGKVGQCQGSIFGGKYWIVLSFILSFLWKYQSALESSVQLEPPVLRSQRSVSPPHARSIPARSSRVCSSYFHPPTHAPATIFPWLLLGSFQD